MSHLHPSVTVPQGSYRPCNPNIIKEQIGEHWLDQYAEAIKPVIEYDKFGNHDVQSFVGLVFHVKDGNGFVRVLYNWMDLYNVEILKPDGMTYRWVSDVDAYDLPDYVRSARKDVLHGVLQEDFSD